MLKEKVKYAKRFMNKDHDYEFSKARHQVRDFGATLMTLPELEAGVRRATKRARKATGEKHEMYVAQIKAYEARVMWYSK